ncbi:MAG: adenosylmethionine--8-amino-7-oxononanoate transaminase [Verrucomicrobiaceae bacterium]|nr:adenosylmethionine--8-amino-7-oxononanoate transaminase [Verrucomicrobiaceae bacterium]
MNPDREALRRLDKAHLWHPFTQMRDWCASEEDPLVIVSGEGAILTDIEGNEYLDGNSSIWTNVHGHRHPVIDAAVREQLERIAHCSALGFSNEPAIRLAEKLVGFFPEDTLTRVFFTDDGSTAIECACRMALQYRELRGQNRRRRFLAFDGAYHGDTIGAASLGGIATFHGKVAAMGYDVSRLATVEALESLDDTEAEEVNAVVIEPLVQGAAGMRLWPAGMLRRIRQWCDRHGAFLILDEVMTGFGRTGRLFACEHEEAVPDFLCLAKGLTGGYMPLAATLTTEEVYSAFLGRYEERKTFFYGHSYCANPLGCAAALGNLRVFAEENVIAGLPPKIEALATALKEAKEISPHFGEIRQIGLIAAIDLLDQATGEPLDWREETGAKVCRRARAYGLLTRPIRDTLVLMPPLCVTEKQIREAVGALVQASADVLGA